MPKRRREFQKEKSALHGGLSKQTDKNPEAPAWPDERPRYFPVIGIVLIALCTLIIYGQTIPVLPIDYEDPFYLVHSPYIDVRAAFSSLGAVWTEPYFANFHPVTTTTWLVDRALTESGTDGTYPIFVGEKATGVRLS